MAGRRFFLIIAILTFSFACSREKPVEPKPPAPTPAPTVILKPKPSLLDEPQRVSLGFPPHVLASVESAAGAEAEPFYESVLVHSENLKGEQGYERKQLSGFSVRTKKADEVIASCSSSLRKQGFLIFRSKKNHRNVPDVVTVVRGRNSYDILKIQKTEAPNYHLDTKAIIAWLKALQKQAPFVITGANVDRVEAKFIKPPRDMKSFAKKIAGYAPDTVTHVKGSMEELVKYMKKNNGFFLEWD